MKNNTWIKNGLKKAFPKGKRWIGFFQGLILAALLWMPLPEDVLVPVWAVVAAVFLLCGAVLWCHYFGGGIIQLENMGWRALGLCAAGVIFPRIPLGDSMRAAVNPAGFLVAGAILLLLHMAVTLHRVSSEEAEL